MILPRPPAIGPVLVPRPRLRRRRIGGSDSVSQAVAGVRRSGRLRLSCAISCHANTWRRSRRCVLRLPIAPDSAVRCRRAALPCQKTLAAIVGSPCRCVLDESGAEVVVRCLPGFVIARFSLCSETTVSGSRTQPSSLIATPWISATGIICARGG
jgi:hypothetical protein